MNTVTDAIQYAPTHEWVRIDSNHIASVGISGFAQSQLGDVVFLELPKIGRQVRAGESVATIESVKTASDIHSPLSGEIIEVNTALTETPEAVNDDPYSAWLFRLTPNNREEEMAGLMDEAAYRQQTLE
ncbi:MAG: glycine cleavage system protein GcvH [Methylococcaceae bacterium]